MSALSICFSFHSSTGVITWECWDIWTDLELALQICLSTLKDRSAILFWVRSTTLKDRWWPLTILSFLGCSATLFSEIFIVWLFFSLNSLLKKLLLWKILLYYIYEKNAALDICLKAILRGFAKKTKAHFSFWVFKKEKFFLLVNIN